MKLVVIPIATVLLFFAFSCAPSQREMAVAKINQAKLMLENGDTTNAISMLDSVALLYPKAEVQIAVSNNIKNDLFRQLIEKRREELAKTDSLIIVLEQNFLKEKTQYDKYNQYIHKSQTFNRSWNRSYLGIHLDERGELYLSSNYTGKEHLNHTGIRVYDGRLQAKSENVEIGHQLNHQSEFNNIYWEKVSYMNGKADSVIRFIDSYPNLSIKCVFLGNKQYYILLEKHDITAVKDALALSEAIKKRKKLEAELDYWRRR